MPTCNGCNQQRPTTDEHLIHRSVGEALLGTVEHENTAAVRRALLDGYVRFEGGAADVTHSDVRMDGVIRNLLCAECNAGWANELETAAGRNLYGFLHEDRPLDAALFYRWFAFFQFKAHMYYARSESLQSGPLADLFSRIRNPEAHISFRIHGARLDADTTRWQFNFFEATPGSEVAPGFSLVTHGVIWFMPYSSSDPPADLAEITTGLRLNDLPLIPPALMRGTLIPNQTVEVLGTYVNPDEEHQQQETNEEPH